MTISADKYPEYVEKMIKHFKEKYPDDDITFCINQNTYNAPIRFKEATPDKLDKRVKELMSKPKEATENFYLYGSVGTGKTFSAYAIARLLYANKTDVKVRSYIDMLDKIKSSFDKPGSDDYVNDLLFKNDVLILDDLGSEKITDWSIEILYKLINKRYENMMGLILISNHSIKDLSEQYGDRITSRITEMMQGNIVKFTGKDRRMKNN